ncbi:TonB-dependent receptor [Flavobacterium agricola]|uniref:TonB-dependent receptor n=1 Tax=Flavobacterium agricola TaxID=2870839 RepID=A0ABY6M0B0_9FLAO|nr:TonB-dependent receptor [Flavobacterium agricola]UYW01712.1 TonB-dependent receptor [Flavobacterium agricola]
MKFKKAGIILLATYNIGAQAQNNQATNLDEIVISENRLELPFSQTARNIQVITAKQISELPVRSVNEVLGLIGGVDLRQRGPFGTQADVSIDGGSFEQTLILLNGVKVSDAQTAHHSLNLPVALDAIERIEVLKGPAARIYGINTLTGAINIVTKKAKENNLYANIYSGSSFKSKDENDGNGIYWGGGLQLTGTLAREKSNHLFALNTDQYNGHRYNTAAEIYRGFYQGNFDVSDKSELNVMLGQIFNKFGANGFYAAPGDKESEEVVNTSFASVGMTYKINDRLFIKPRISNRYNEDDYRYFRHNLASARSLHYTNVVNAEVNASYLTNFGTFGLGWESRWEQINSSNIGSHKRNNHGFYVEYKTIIAEKLFVNAGGYANYNSDYGWEFFPGVDAAYQFLPNFKLGLNVGSSQRVPSFTDLYLNQRPGNIGNPNLNSEKAWQYEANIRYNKKQWHAQAGYFYRNISDFIDWIRTDSSEPYQPFNAAKNKIHGVNFQVRNVFTLNNASKIQASVSYNYLKPEEMVMNNGLTSKYVVESLKHQAIATVNYSYKNWYVQGTYKYQKRELRNGYDITNFRLGYNLDKLGIYGDFTNVFDKQYREIAATPMPGRWFVLGAKYRLK